MQNFATAHVGQIVIGVVAIIILIVLGVVAVLGRKRRTQDLRVRLSARGQLGYPTALIGS